MAQAHPTQAVAATKLSREQAARLDRAARRQQMTRSAFIRAAIQEALSAAGEPLTEAERVRHERREREADLRRRLAEVKSRLYARNAYEPGIRRHLSNGPSERA